jgi:hypothetical protein
LKEEMAFFTFGEARYVYFSITSFMLSNDMVLSDACGRRRCSAKKSLLAAMAMDEVVALGLRSTCSPRRLLILTFDSLHVPYAT